jgi:hypothetical protein
MTYNQADNIAERRNTLGNDPGNDPATQPNGNPGANRDKISLVHAISLAEDAYIDVFQSNVAIDDTSADNLSHCERPHTKKSGIDVQ